MKRSILSLLLLLGVIVPTAYGAPINWILNGDFSQGLEHWEFVDDCKTSFGHNKAWVENGKAWVESYKTGYGAGYLIQDLGCFILPTRFRLDYHQVVGQGCGGIGMGIDSGGTDIITYNGKPLGYWVGEHDVDGDYAYLRILQDQFFHKWTHDKTFEKGTLEITFDYEHMEGTARVICSIGTHSITFPIHSPESMLTNAVWIGASNPCWDGRNYEIGKYDNIIIEGLPLTVPAAIDIDPDTLNLNSKGKWITCYIELPEGYDVEDIDVSTIKLNDQIPAESHPTGIGDNDNDGIPDLMVKFDRAAVQQMLQTGNEVEITVTGELTDGTLFEGTDTIRVIDKGGKK